MRTFIPSPRTVTLMGGFWGFGLVAASLQWLSHMAGAVAGFCLIAHMGMSIEQAKAMLKAAETDAKAFYNAHHKEDNDNAE
jgi:hypothetical protein